MKKTLCLKTLAMLIAVLSATAVLAGHGDPVSSLSVPLPPGLGEINVSGAGNSILDGDVSPSTVDGTAFGQVLDCNGSIVHGFLIQNIGTDTLRLTGVGIVGTNAGDFSASLLPAFLLPGQSHTFTITFDPGGSGPRQANVTIVSDDIDEANFDFAVSGTGLADNAPPVASCQTVHLYLGAAGTATLLPSQVNNGSTDNCGIVSMSLSRTSFFCGNNQPVSDTLTVIDGAGLSSSCTAAVVVHDTTRPVARCKSSISVLADIQGIAFLTPSMLDSGSYDNCGINPVATILNPSVITCNGSTNPVIRTVYMSITDQWLNSSACSTIVYVHDSLGPTIYHCPQDTVLVNPAGSTNYNTCSGNLNLYQLEVFESCASITCMPANTSYTCANIGVQTVATTFTDGWGNSSTCAVEVTVLPGGAPTAVCQNATVSLGSNGIATLQASMIDGGSTATCGTALTYSMSPASFSCNQLGPQSVVLTATSIAGLSASCTATVNVLDQSSPVVTCAPLTVTLGANGTATVPASALLQSAADNCGVVSQTANQTQFSCADINGTPVTVTVSDAAGNSSTCTAVVTAIPQPLNLQVNAVLRPCGYNLNCANGQNGSATAVMSGGCGNYTYQWSTGGSTAQVNGLGAGTYQVTVTDQAGNSQNASITLTAPPALQLQVSPGPGLCFGDSNGTLSALVAGGSTCAPYSYQWSQGAATQTISGLPAGAYVVTVTDAQGCVVAASAQVTQFPAPIVVVNQVGSSLSATGGYASYQWHDANGPIPGATGSQFTPTANGTYFVTIVTGDACPGQSNSFPFIMATAAAPGFDTGLSLFPNPSNGSFQLQMSVPMTGPVLVQVQDLRGRGVYEAEFDQLEDGQAFDLSALAAGNYFLLVKAADGLTYRTRWVKE